MVKPKTVAAIGGGVSGLAAAKAFHERGLDVTAFARSDDRGGVWEPSRSYPEVRTQSPEDLYRFTDLPMPDDFPAWPQGHQVHAHLHTYAQKHGLHTLHRLGTTVRHMDRPDDGGPGWTLTLDDGTGTRAERVDFVANWLVRYADGMLARQPTEAEMRADIEAMLAWRRTERPAAQVYGGLCSAPFHFKHFDELLADMGATVRRRANPLTETFTPPDAAAYGRFLASAPHYRAAPEMPKLEAAE